MKPSVGVLEGEGQMEVGVTVGEQLAPSALVRDKFLVMATPAPSADLSSQEVSQLFRVREESVLPLTSVKRTFFLLSLCPRRQVRSKSKTKIK